MSDPKLTFWAEGILKKSTATARHALATFRFATAANADFVFEADIAPNESLPIEMGSLEQAEFLFVRALGGDLVVTIKPEGATDSVNLKVNDGLLLFGTRVTVEAVSSIAGCHVLICGAAK